jgi:hypothetical protein
MKGFRSFKRSETTTSVHRCEWMSYECAHAPRGQRQPKSELDNDPSAGSPTETLLRLLLPLNDQV